MISNPTKEKKKEILDKNSAAESKTAERSGLRK